MSEGKVKPFVIRPEDQEMVMSALHEYKRVLAGAASKKGVSIYSRLIDRADVMFRELWKNRYGTGFGAEDDDNG